MAETMTAKKLLNSITGLFALTLLLGTMSLSCTREPLVGHAPEAENTVLSARKNTIITRSGDESAQFDEGTRYCLFALEVGTDWSSALLYNREGLEAAGHVISYGELLTYGDKPISFYGVTDGTASRQFTVSEAPASPQVSVAVQEDNSLQDVMYSNNLLACTAEQGHRLQMEYRHALSKLKFTIVKQDESGDAEEDHKLDNVRLTGISINGTRSAGTLDVVQGLWNYSAEESRISRKCFQGDMEVTSSSSHVPGETILFPNTDGSELSVSVTLEGLEESPKTVTYPLRSVDPNGNDLGPFVMEMNHQYTLMITVLKNEVRTIAIAPQIYDWVDVDLPEEEIYLGQPVTFANLLWMDRNLGARSADCENDWEACRGYYYQYARNIPYILDKEMYDASATKIPIYPFIYTYNQHGEKVYGGYRAGAVTEDNIPVRHPNVAINPGDEGIYQFIWDYNNTASGIWLLDETAGREEEQVSTYWANNPQNQPCPKGWRLPTKEDFASFLPERSLGSGYWYNSFKNFSNYTANTLGYREDLICGTINGERAIYIIKRKGREDCYRIRILLKESKTPGKWYYEFAYFSGNADMSFSGVNNVAAFNSLDMDWTTPSAQMQVPACGFIHTAEGGTEYNPSGNKLNNDGISVILRTSDPTAGGGMSCNWVCYLRPDVNFGLYSGSRKALGDQIRCVRDVNATY